MELTLVMIGAACIAVFAAALVSEKLRRARVASRVERIASGGSSADAAPKARIQGALSRFIASLTGKKLRESVRKELSAAGFYEEWHADTYLAAYAFIVAAGALCGIWLFDIRLAPVSGQVFPILKFLILLFICGRLPQWWLSGMIRENRAKIVAAVPQAVDFMIICVESGMGLEDAFQKVGEEMRTSAPEVASEMRLTRSEMLVLDRSRALMRLKTRTGVREMENLADALLQSIRFGTPIVDTLQNIAEDCRASQISQMEENAGAISAKVGVPLILFILFPLVVLLVSPAVVLFFRSL